MRGIGSSTRHRGSGSCSGHGVSVRAALVVLTVASFAPHPVVASDFVGSPGECGLAISLLAGTALLEAFPINDDHPLIGGEQRSYIVSERVSNWVLAAAHGVALGTIRFGPGGDERVRYAHGYFMAASMNAFGTSLAKAVVGRRRPNYEAAKARGAPAKSKSFYSGHASNGFLIATYASLYTWRRTESLAWRAALPPVLYTAAVYNAWSRVADHRHYTSDVIVGAIAGTAVSSIVFRWYDGMRGDEPPSVVRFGPYPGGVSFTYRF